MFFNLNKYYNFFLLYIFSFFILFIFLSTTPASIYLGDTGETVSVSFVLGIQHPPGYPLFSLLGKLFSYIPIGDVSYRIYLLSIFLSFINFYLLFFLSKDIFKILKISEKLSIFPPFIFLTGYTIWQQSIIAKGGIYILNIFFILLISILLMKIYHNKRNKKYIFLISFLYGLSLGNHLMLQIVFFISILIFLYKIKIFKNISIKNYLYIIFFFFLGVSIYLYLPIRGKSSILNWGEPYTFSNFFKVIIRYQYINSEISKSFYNTFNQIIKFLTCSIKEFTIAGFLVLFPGLLFLYKKEKNIFIFLISIPILFLLVTSFYLNLSKERLYIMETYITPIYFVYSIFVVLGIFYLNHKFKFIIKNNYFMYSLIFFIIISFQVISFFPKLNKSRYFFAYDYNKNILMSLEKNSILFMAGDGIVFPQWYFKYVKKYRPDVIIIGTPVLPMKWVRDNIKKQNPDVKIPEITRKVGTESIGYIINAIIKLNIQKYPIYFSYNKPDKNSLTSNLKIMPKGIVFKVIPINFAIITPQYIKVIENIWKVYALRIFYPFKKYMDKKTKNLYIKDYSICANSTGTLFEDNKLYDLSLKYYIKAHKINPNDYEFIYNIGNAYYYLKKPYMAIKMYKKALSINPDYENALYNLGVIYYNMKNYKESLNLFLKIKKLNPQRHDIDNILNFLKKVTEYKYK